MVDITWADVSALAPELATLPLATQTFILAQANTELSLGVWGDRLNVGRVYLAAHLASVARGKAGGVAGPVTSETVGSVSRSYGNGGGAYYDNFGSTSYGRELDRLIMQLPAARFTVA